MAISLAAAVLGAIAGCSSERGVAPGQPVVRDARADPNVYSVLSSVVTFNVLTGGVARVVSVAPGDSSATPFASIAAGTVHITTLGLLPNTSYTQIIEVTSGFGHSAADTVHFTTGTLPAYVQRAALRQLTGIFSGGLTLVSPLGYVADTALALAFDSADRVRWYRLFPGHASIELKQQPNNHFTIYLNYITGLGTSSANSSSANGTYVEFLPGGDSIHSYAAANGLPTDAHEMWLSGGTNGPGTAHLFGVDTRSADLTPIGGPPDTTIGGHWLFRVDPVGSAEFAWDAWGHYAITDCVLPYSGTGGDFDHPNALDFDLDSNYIVSFRNMSAILKLNYQIGATMWQMGGTHNQFTFVNDPQAMSFTAGGAGGTSGQHSVRVLANGHLLIYDNGNLQPTPHTRAVEYALDTVAKTATMVWEYVPNPPIFTVAVGSVQRLANGNTLVGFGFAGQIHEVDAHANLVASAAFTLNGVPQFYRANRIQSLYTYAPLNGR